MPNQPDILCFSSSDWDGIWGSRQQVMLRFARRGHRILFVERPIGLEHWLRYPDFRQRKWRRWQEGVCEVEANLFIASLPVLVPGRYYSTAINRMNQWLTLSVTKRFIKQVGINNPVLWLYNPHQGALIGQFQDRFSVYHCIDEWTAGTQGRKHHIIQTLERELLRKVDIVFANSPPLYAAKRQLNEATHRVPSGVDFEHFAPDTNRALHPQVAVIPTPRIGYSGHINDRLDYTVLNHLAHSAPQWSFVFVGDTYPWTMATPQLRQLATLPNVHFLGKRPYTEMPAIVQGFDVCLMPYVADDRGHYRSPLKLYEYFAAGKAVVSTSHPEAEEYQDVLYQAETPETFFDCVRSALEESDLPQQQIRIELARQHSWDARVDTMNRILSTMFPNQWDASH